MRYSQRLVPLGVAAHEAQWLARTPLGDDVAAVPYVQLGASDSRWFTRISSAVYRFAPFSLSNAEREALHSHDERIHVDAWLRGIDFYRALIARR